MYVSYIKRRLDLPHLRGPQRLCADALCAARHAGAGARPAAAAKGQTPVYETASTSAAQLTTLFAGEEVTVIAHNGSWACLRTEENVTGYAPLSALDRLSGNVAPTATPAPSQGFGDSEGVITETVPAISIANTYVYKSPSTSSENQGVLTAGRQVTVLMRNDTWAYITAGGKYGFCKLGALQPLSSATQTPSTDHERL